jgi:hypothetical protein
VCEKLWRPFTAPIVDGTFGTRDFARLMVSRRTLFQSEDVLISGVIAKEQGGVVKSSAKGTKDLLHMMRYPLIYRSSPRTTILLQIYLMRLISSIIQPGPARPNLLHESGREEAQEERWRHSGWEESSTSQDSTKHACSIALFLGQIACYLACYSSPFAPSKRRPPHTNIDPGLATATVARQRCRR